MRTGNPVLPKRGIRHGVVRAGGKGLSLSHLLSLRGRAKHARIWPPHAGGATPILSTLEVDRWKDAIRTHCGCEREMFIILHCSKKAA